MGRDPLKDLIENGYPTDGKPKEHHNLPSGKQIAGFVVVLIIVGAIAFFAGTTQMPVKTATDASAGGDAKAIPVPAEKEAAMAGAAGIASANSAAASTETEKIEIPPDAWILEVRDIDPSGPEVSKKVFPIGKTPANIWVKSRFTIFKNVKITSKQISGTTVIESPTSAGTQSAIWLYFYKDSNLIKGLLVYTPPKASSGNSGNKFKMEFPEDVWTANEVVIVAQVK